MPETMDDTVVRHILMQPFIQSTTCWLALQPVYRSIWEMQIKAYTIIIGPIRGV